MTPLAGLHLPTGRIAKRCVVLTCGLWLLGCQALYPSAPATPPGPAQAAAPSATARTLAPVPPGPSQSAPSTTPVPTDPPSPPAPDTPAGLAQPSAPEPAPLPYRADELLGYFYQLRLLGPPQLATELARLEAAPPSPAQRLQLALALTHTLQLADTQRALALVQEVLESPDADSLALRPLAHILSHVLREQRRLELQNERLGQQLRDTQRRAEQLNDRLEAMRAIERSLNRPVPRSAPARPVTP